MARNKKDAQENVIQEHFRKIFILEQLELTQQLEKQKCLSHKHHQELIAKSFEVIKREFQENYQ